jgi:non-lysosomal glucosylceramidase
MTRFDLSLVPWHEGTHRSAVAMPLGGIGTGTVAIAGDGSLRQWQLTGPGNHAGFVPDSLFALRCSRAGGEDLIRVLEAEPAEGPRVPNSIDGVVPAGLLARHTDLKPLAESRIRTAYPVAEVEFTDEDLPIEVTLQAFTPFVPLDEERSALPAALFEFTLRNPGPDTTTGWIAGSLQNVTGWDGVAPIEGTTSAGYGGAVNRERRAGATSSIVMSNALLPGDDPRYGQLVLSTDGAGANILEQYGSAAEFTAFLNGRFVLDHHLAETRAQPRTANRGQYGGLRTANGPSPAGSTWNGAIATPFRLGAGDECRVRYWFTWWFPNRYVDFVQFGDRDDGRSRLWLGAHYATIHPDAISVSDLVSRDWDELADATREWIEVFRGQDPIEAEHQLAQGSMIRTVSTFRSSDGTFYGFEGIQGASTASWADNGGSCPLNCTHVWNYAQAVARLFPRLERSMRDTEFDIMQSPDGAIPHRVVVPPWTRQPWGEAIGGPVEPALDGMLGAPLKVLRELQHGASTEWLARRWPALLRLFRHIRDRWMTSTGVLDGPQPSTFDIPLHGANPYIGSLWLAALLALERLAVILADHETAAETRILFDMATVAYDRLLYTGEYFAQVLGSADPRAGSWQSGCLTDQLVGQWWAHQLGLGYVLPNDHVKTALQSIVAYNVRNGFVITDGEGVGRVFADGDDVGLVNCTWPHGGRPEDPVWYSDEVWTGVEQQLAASLLYEGFNAEADVVLAGLRARHDGRRRNPFNHVECGDHYVRAMSGFSVIEARSGIRLDATDGSVTIGPHASNGTSPFFHGSAWGTVTLHDSGVELHVRGGEFDIREVRRYPPD